ncbi:MAG: hypothetical protein A3E01_12330 [Gammaproteobacteria bacterium RIFCSPHIGHO2_12_FULL_63_22]|nr:MAG: hypothetical protein A3E01_12330 [Gammaproteobacteria bacterium RIFCSPHIGHO2_12_FULL_63_22]
MTSTSAPGASGKGKRAILKDAVSCRADQARATAPRGEYEIEEVAGAGGACSIGLCSCATHNRFTLSFDAFVQHLNEGRIAVVG